MKDYKISKIISVRRRKCWNLEQRTEVQGGADKSLARTNSRCCRAESIVSLERGVCSCSELQVFSCYRG